MLKNYYLGGLFWVLILHKQYQNMSGFAGDAMIKIDTQDLIDITDIKKHNIEYKNDVTNLSYRLYFLSKQKLCKEIYFSNF